MENTFRDVNIALANELSKICNHLEINCLDAIALANKHPRVNIHSPGPGVGGHCIAIDPYFISAKAPDIARIIRMGRDTNNSMPRFVADHAERLLAGIAEPKIAALGVAYKGNTDDARESPTLEVIEILRKAGFHVAIHDDHVKRADCVSLADAVSGADLMLVLTDHDEYRETRLHGAARRMRRPMIFDTRNIVSPHDGGFVYNFGNIFAAK